MRLRGRPLAPLFLLLFLGHAASAAPVECRAELRAEPRTENTAAAQTAKVFAVEIESSESCAKVYFDVVTTERLFDGEEITSTAREWRKVTTPTTFKVTHRIARDSTLVNAEFKLVRCVVCGSEAR